MQWEEPFAPPSMVQWMIIPWWEYTARIWILFRLWCWGPVQRVGRRFCLIRSWPGRMIIFMISVFLPGMRPRWMCFLRIWRIMWPGRRSVSRRISVWWQQRPRWARWTAWWEAWQRRWEGSRRSLCWWGESGLWISCWCLWQNAPGRSESARA